MTQVPTVATPAPLLMCLLLACVAGIARAQAPSPKDFEPATDPPPFNWPALDIPSPVRDLGHPLKDLSRVLVLNVYEDRKAQVARIVADVDGTRAKELPLNDPKDAAASGPLALALKSLKAKHGDGFRVLINADPDARYVSLQPIFKACANAGVADLGFIYRVLNARTNARAYLPWTMPINVDGEPESKPELTIYIASIPGTGTFSARTTKGDQASDDVSLMRLLEAKLKVVQAASTTPDAAKVVFAPRLSTRYEHLLMAYELATLARWPRIGFQEYKE